jgi:2-oxoisovalerate dehydrogenase E1 component
MTYLHELIAEKRKLLRDLFLIRAGDLREERLLRQGRGWIHIPGQGHEALAVLAASLEADDLLFLYYRDRALMQARGVTPLEMARSIWRPPTRRRRPADAGPRVVRRLGITTATPPPRNAPAVAQLGNQAGRQRVVLHDRRRVHRQGDSSRQCPSVRIVSRSSSSSRTTATGSARRRSTSCLRLAFSALRCFATVDGRSVDAVAEAGSTAIAAARRGDGPTILWMELDRMTSHTNSDDHRIYRSAAEIALMKARDPVTCYAASLVDSGALDAAQVRALQDEATAEADAAYAAAEIEPAPTAQSANTKLLGPFEPKGHLPPFALEEASNTMAANTTGEVLSRIRMP